MIYRLNFFLNIDRHHDAGTPSMHEPYQTDRFATLLLYLNENMTGGETSFPRWMNADTSEALKVTPKIGQAILFYNYLPVSFNKTVSCFKWYYIYFSHVHFSGWKF